MDERRLADSLTDLLGPTLSASLAAQFVQIRRDLATKTLERAAPGKFVETFVQCLQQMATGAYDARADVDAYLSRRAENEAAVPEGLRICATRIARSIYTLRNKRNIAHKNPIDLNTCDLAYIQQGAAWIVAELIRCATGITMQEAGSLIELIHAPVGSLVEEIDGTRLVHADVPLRAEILILLHSYHPEYVPVARILSSLRARNAGTVRNHLNQMRIEKLIHGDTKKGYRVTQAGYASAINKINELLSDVTPPLALRARPDA